MPEKLKRLFHPDSRELLRHSKNYLGWSILSKAVAFFSIPVFTRLLTPGEYGFVALFNSFLNVGVIVFLLNFHAAIKVNYLKKEYEFRSYLITNLAALSVFSGFMVLAAYAFLPGLSEFFEMPPLLLMLAVGASALAIYSEVYNYLLQGQKRSFAAAFVQASREIAVVGLSILFFLQLRESPYLGVGYATVLVHGLYAVAALYFFYRMTAGHPVRFVGRYLSDSLKFGLPLLPHTLSGFALAFIDRIVINQLAGETATGLYAFAYNIGMVMHVVVISLNKAWQPIYWEGLTAGAIDKVNRVAGHFSKYVYLSGFGLMLFGKELAYLMGSAEYREALGIVPVIVASYIFFYLYTLFSGVAFYNKKTWLISVNTLIVAAINVGLNYTLIPIYGYQVSAWNSLVSYALLFVMHYVSNRYLLGDQPIRLSGVMPDLVILGIFSAVFALAVPSGGAWGPLAAKAALFCLFALMLYRHVWSGKVFKRAA